MNNDDFHIPADIIEVGARAQYAHDQEVEAEVWAHERQSIKDDYRASFRAGLEACFRAKKVDYGPC